MPMPAADDAHRNTVARLRHLANSIPPRDVGAAFVASLSSRKLEYRSALGSYALARVIPAHNLEPERGAYATVCAACGWAQMPPGEEEPLDILRSERATFGGIRHLDPDYALLDLEEFVTLPSLPPSPKDWRCLDLILRSPGLLAADAKAADLARSLKGIVRANQNERTVLIRILVYAGVLTPQGYPTFFDGFVPPQRRVLPPQRFADWGYPTIWWRAGHGVRADAIAFWFAHSEGRAV